MDTYGLVGKLTLGLAAVLNMLPSINRQDWQIADNCGSSVKSARNTVHFVLFVFFNL